MAHVYNVHYYIIAGVEEHAISASVRIPEIDIAEEEVLQGLDREQPDQEEQFHKVYRLLMHYSISEMGSREMLQEAIRNGYFTMLSKKAMTAELSNRILSGDVHIHAYEIGENIG